MMLLQMNRSKSNLFCKRVATNKTAVKDLSKEENDPRARPALRPGTTFGRNKESKEKGMKTKRKVAPYRRVKNTRRAVLGKREPKHRTTIGANGG
jgi:hypothetical protein